MLTLLQQESLSEYFSVFLIDLFLLVKIDHDWIVLSDTNWTFVSDLCFGLSYLTYALDFHI